jgi:deoxyribonuclease-2
MGNCFTCCHTATPFVKVALKLPHGLNGMVYDEKTQHFQPLESIDNWLLDLYSSSHWTGWIVYNDETSHLGDTKHTKGHCKGIVAWNDTRISWLIHSLPNFPRIFTGATISEIESSEHVYGQSFCYNEFPKHGTLLEDIIHHVRLMEAHIFMEHNVPPIIALKKDKHVHALVLHENITHVAKSSIHTIDIYSDYLAKQDTSTWYIETWQRGSPITKKCDNVKEVHMLKWNDVEYKESQDHSKWACTDIHCWVGDLNRMKSQYKRGGGGVLIKHPAMAKAFKGLIVS